MDNKEIGNRILKLRKDNGYTQAQVATKVSVSPQAVSKWEKGDAMPDVEMLGQLASIFGVTCDYLILGIDSKEISGRETLEDNKDDDIETNDNEIKYNDEDSAAINNETVGGDAYRENDAVNKKKETSTIYSEETQIEIPKDIVEDKTKSEKTRIIDEVGPTPHVKVKNSNNEDNYKAAKKMLGTYKTIKWSAMMMPLIVSVLLLSLVITAFVLSFNVMENAIGHIPTLCTVLVVTIVIALLLANYVVYKIAEKYRIFLDGPIKNKYPHNAGGYIMSGFKKFFVWIGKYTIAIKLLYDANKRLKTKINTLRETVVDLERLRKL